VNISSFPLPSNALLLCCQIKEAKKVQLEKEIERKEYFETMRSKYFYSKPAIPTDGGGGINLRAFLKTAKT
jgi:hypothetical protein